MNLNKAFILGNLTRDPEIKTLPSGSSVATFGVATNRFWTDKMGQKQKEAQFHNIVMFGKTAEIAKQYLQKGSLVFIEGRIQTRSWNSQDGTKKYKTEIIAETMQLGPRYAGGNGYSQSNNNSNANETPSQSAKEEIDTIEYPEDIDPEDIPF